MRTFGGFGQSRYKSSLLHYYGVPFALKKKKSDGDPFVKGASRTRTYPCGYLAFLIIVGVVRASVYRKLCIVVEHC